MLPAQMRGRARDDPKKAALTVQKSFRQLERQGKAERRPGKRAGPPGELWQVSEKNITEKRI